MFGFKETQKKLNDAADAVKRNADVATEKIAATAADVKKKSKLAVVFAGIQAFAWVVMAGCCVYSVAKTATEEIAEQSALVLMDTRRCDPTDPALNGG